MKKEPAGVSFSLLLPPSIQGILRKILKAKGYIFFLLLLLLPAEPLQLLLGLVNINLVLLAG